MDEDGLFSAFNVLFIHANLIQFDFKLRYCQVPLVCRHNTNY